MMLEELVAAALSLALLWCLHRAWRTPGDPALWMVSACLAFMALSYPLGWLARAAEADPAGQHGIPKVLLNAVIMLGYFFLMLFFLFSAASAGKGVRHQAWREVIPLAAALIAQTVSMALTPDHLRDHKFSTTDLQIPGIASFYFAGASYLVYVLVQAARFALRYAAESNRRVRIGLRMAAVGLGIRALSGSLRVLLVVVFWLGGNVPDAVREMTATLAVIGGGLFVTGVLCPAVLLRIATMRVWWQHRRAYRELRPLWEVLNSVYPKDALDRRTRSLWRERVSPRRVRRRYWRRVIEIRDGLVQLSPHLADFGYSPSRPADQQITTFQCALRHRYEGLPATTSSAVLVAAPPVGNVESDVAELLALTRKIVLQQGDTPHRRDTGLRARNAFMIDRIRAQDLAPYAERRYVLRVLAISGRATGEIRSVPIAVTQLDGQRYVCAPHRQRDWVRNLLAAGQAQIERDTHPTHRAVLVEGDEAARAIHTYLHDLGNPSMIWPFPPNAPVSEILAHTSTTAVFRLEPHPG
ncbi:hypothetical protein FDZ84_29315 [Saccharopolyspora sp. ASAGF58]|nr:MAB_1171c family putative transporter [Saccharopolyspora sp. ASAGF58]QIZ37917.1 hypothetical protein FDZ84_29315 [Saccharopolyspora sp. ASAGF58]